MKILSVIVPAYNMEDYLKKNLETLIINKGFDNIEIIVVNDGSTDRTLDIAQEFVNRHPNNFVLINKENGNYGSCINAALNVAIGKYVKIMDADDSFFTDNFEKLVSVLLSLDVDLVITDYIKSYTSGKIEDYIFNFPLQQTVLFDDVYNTQAIYDILLPAITYKTEILRRINYNQTEGISYTDTQWCFTPMTQVRTIYY